MIFVGALLVGLCAGFLDSIAGGGGLISLPALLAFGLPPQLALGTNKLQSCFGSLTASVHFFRERLIKRKLLFPGVLLTVLGAFLGTQLISSFSNDWLGKFIPILLVGVALYSLWNRKLGLLESQERSSAKIIICVLGFALGFYDGFFGPGTGNFWCMGLILFVGLNFRSATAQTKVMNFASNLVALLVFWGHDMVSVPLGVIMGFGQLIGASIGARIVIKKNVQLIRIFFIVVVLILAIRLFWQNYFG